MSDHTSPVIFAKVFELLARHDLSDSCKVAREVWELSQEYDFYNEDMGCEEALEKLGLARRNGTPDEDPAWFYGPEDEDKS